MKMEEVRAELHVIAVTHGIPRLHALADETKRKFHGRRAPIRQGTPTAEQAYYIRNYAAEHPDAALNEIGVVFGFNQGRVSEVLFGKRS